MRTLNVRGLNTLIKSRDYLIKLKSRTQYILATEIHFKYRHKYTKSKNDRERYTYHANTNQKKLEVVILI